MQPVKTIKTVELILNFLIKNILIIFLKEKSMHWFLFHLNALFLINFKIPLHKYRIDISHKKWFLLISHSNIYKKIQQKKKYIHSEHNALTLNF